MAGGVPQEWLRSDYYAILGVPVTASQEDIISAYRRQARAGHPDVDTDNPRATERFEELAAARLVLGDPEVRAAYDQARRLHRPAASEGSPDGARTVPVRRAPARRPQYAEPPVRPGPVIWVRDAEARRREEGPRW